MATVEAGCQEEAQKKKRSEEEEEEGGEWRKVRKEIAQEVVAGIKKEASAHEDAKPTAQRIVGQRVNEDWRNGNR